MTDKNSLPSVPSSILVVDIGGSRLKMLVTGETEQRDVESGSKMTAAQAVEAIHQLAAGWQYDAVVIGFPGPVNCNVPTKEPTNLGRGWKGFDFGHAFPCAVTVVNDALLQAVGSYEGGRMLFLGLGTGLGSALILDDVAHPLELARLPYRKKRSFEDYLGADGLDRLGPKKWNKRVHDAVQRLRDALLVEDIVIGGGNASKIETLPDGSRLGSNAQAFLGGFRLAGADAIRLCSEEARPHGSSRPPD